MIKRITEADTDIVTVSAGVANTETVVIDIQTPDAYKLIIRNNSIFDLYLANSTPTEIEDSAEIKVCIAPPDKIEDKTIAKFPYRQIKNADPYKFQEAKCLECRM